MLNTNYSTFLISNEQASYNELQKSISPEHLNYFDGTGYPSFSKLVNDCISSANTEIVIIMSDKVRPTSLHIKKMLHLINQGYGIVGLYRYAFFGLKKELLRKIGMFDERYIGGGFEDYDMTVRLIESNIAMYITEEVTYLPRQSKWNYELSYPFWCTKWKHHWNPELSKIPEIIERTMKEENYNYNLGPSVNTNFLPCREFSYVGDNIHVEPFFRMKIK